MGRIFKKHPLTVFRVVQNDQAPLPLGYSNHVDERLSKLAFEGIDNTTDEQSVGLVTIENYRSAEFGPGNCEFGEYIVFSVRKDERKIPAAALNRMVEDRIDEEMVKVKEMGKNFISRARKAELKEQVRLRLLARAVPVPKVFDVWWNTQTDLLYITEKSPKLVELAVRMFDSAYGDKHHLEELTLFDGDHVYDAADFLSRVWLRRPSDARFMAETGERVSAWAEEKVNIADSNEEVRAVAQSDDMAGFREIRAGLESGKRVVKAQLVFDSDTLGQFSAVVSAEGIPNIETLSVPRVTHDQEGEFDGALINQIGNMEFAHGVLLSFIEDWKEQRDDDQKAAA